MRTPETERPGRGAGAARQTGWSSNAKCADIGAAALRVSPSLVKALAVEGVLDGQGRLRLDALGERRVISALVAAGLVVPGVQAARPDLRLARLHLRTSVALALTDFEVYRRVADVHDILQ